MPDLDALEADLRRLEMQLTSLQHGLMPAGGGWRNAGVTWRVGDYKACAGTLADHDVGTKPKYHWLYCDGRAISRSTYAALFAEISTTYGVGDGSTTFNLPDRRGRFGFGAAAGQTPSMALGVVDSYDLADRKPTTHTHDMGNLAIANHVEGNHHHPLTLTTGEPDPFPYTTDGPSATVQVDIYSGSGMFWNVGSETHTHNPATHHHHITEQDTGEAGGFTHNHTFEWEYGYDKSTKESANFPYIAEAVFICAKIDT